MVKKINFSCFFQIWLKFWFGVAFKENVEVTPVPHTPLSSRMLWLDHVKPLEACVVYFLSQFCHVLNDLSTKDDQKRLGKDYTGTQIKRNHFVYIDACGLKIQGCFFPKILGRGPRCKKVQGVQPFCVLLHF